MNISIDDSHITTLIALLDVEIVGLGLSELSASALQEIRLLLTAEKIVMRDSKNKGYMLYC